MWFTYENNFLSWFSSVWLGLCARQVKKKNGLINFPSCGLTPRDPLEQPSSWWICCRRKNAVKHRTIACFTNHFTITLTKFPVMSDGCALDCLLIVRRIFPCWSHSSHCYPANLLEVLRLIFLLSNIWRHANFTFMKTLIGLAHIRPIISDSKARSQRPAVALLLLTPLHTFGQKWDQTNSWSL